MNEATSPPTFPDGSRKTVIVTGGAGDIGAQTIRTYYRIGYNVVMADLPTAADAASKLMASLPDHNRVFHSAVDIVEWESIKNLFKTTQEKFGRIDIVVANAGMMESQEFFNFEKDEDGELKEPVEAHKVIDVNVKGTINTIKLAFGHMLANPPDADGSRGSIVIIASTSGYFGGTGVVSYVTSKHAVVGLGRASQDFANKNDIRVNVVAPFFTPTHITAGYAGEWKKSGLPANTIQDVADTIVATSIDPSRKGHSIMVAGKFVREIETERTKLTKTWLGEDISQVMAQGGKFFKDLGGYPLPKPRE